MTSDNVSQKNELGISAGEFEKMISNMNAQYGRTFIGDDFARQWEEVIPALDDRLSRIDYFSNPVERKKAFQLYYDLVRKFNTDGTKRKKPLGIFGGLKFAKSHPDTRFRPEMCMANLDCYFVLGEKFTLGTEYFSR